MKEISVIIVSWNAREFLSDCLNSIRKSGGESVREVIVVDNGSSDASAEMVSEQFPEVTLERSKENLGFARGNNLGIQRATGEYLALINSDVVLHPGSLDQLASCLSRRHEVGLVAPRVLGADGRLQPTCRRLPSVWNITCEILALDRLPFPAFSGRCMRSIEHEQAGEQEVEVLSGCFWMARRSAVEKIGGLDERFFFYAEDVDWCKRFREGGWKVVYVPQAIATHFGGGSSANAPLRYSIELLRANLTYWKKHHGALGQAVFFFLSIVHHAARFLIRGVGVLFRGDPISQESAYKCKRSKACLRWLLTGKGI